MDDKSTFSYGLTPTAFIDPHGGNIESVRRLTHRVVEMVLSRRSHAASVPPLPEEYVLPIDSQIPESAVEEDKILRDLSALVASSANTSSPDYAAHMGAVCTTASVLGDLTASMINNNMIGLELSPSFSLLEERLCEQIAHYFGMPHGSGGMVTTGGSVANLHALTVARNTKIGTLSDGIQESNTRPVFLASEVSHASVAKSAMITGLGTAGSIAVRTDETSRMSFSDLQNVYNQSLDRGLKPFCLVATAGTTVTGNIDPIADMAKFAHDRGLWFHVDAAWGGGLQFSEKLRNRLHGIEEADSITFCPQKLLLVGLSSAVVLYRDMNAMESAFRTCFPYLEEDRRFINRSEIGIQGSRPAEIVKLWMTLQHLGENGIAQLIEHWVTLADYLAESVQRRAGFELVAEPESGIVCFRGTPAGVPETSWDGWNRQLHRFLYERVGICLSLVKYKNVNWLRAVFANPYHNRTLVDRVFSAVDEFPAQARAQPVQV